MYYPWCSAEPSVDLPPPVSPPPYKIEEPILASDNSTDINEKSSIDDDVVKIDPESNNNNNNNNNSTNNSTSNTSEKIKGVFPDPLSGKDSQQKFVWRLSTGKFKYNPSRVLHSGPIHTHSNSSSLICFF